MASKDFAHKKKPTKCDICFEKFEADATGVTKWTIVSGVFRVHSDCFKCGNCQKVIGNNPFHEVDDYALHWIDSFRCLTCGPYVKPKKDDKKGMVKK